MYRDQGSQNRWEPVWFGRFPVESVRPGTRTGPVPTSKPCLNFFSPKTGRFDRFTGQFFWTDETGDPTVF
jgi:hypothetical protein